MKEYIRWIIKTFQPISTCGNPYFRRMCNAWSSRNSNTISASTVTKEMLKVKDQVMEAMKEFLIDQHFALTTDHWTSCSNETYMASTIHYIDEGWIPRSMTLSCDPHTGEIIGVLTAKLLKEAWEVFNLNEDHIVAVVSDTAANVTAAGRHYPCPLIYCAAHNLELSFGIGFSDENLPGAEGTNNVLSTY